MMEEEIEEEVEEIVVFECKDCGKQYDTEEKILDCKKFHRTTLNNLHKSFRLERISLIEHILKESKYHGGIARKMLRRRYGE